MFTRTSLLLSCLTLSVAAACGTDEAVRNGRGSGGGGGGGGGGGTDTGTGADSGLPGDVSDLDTAGMNGLECMVAMQPAGCDACLGTSCAAEMTTAFGAASLPTSAQGACADWITCMQACPCEGGDGACGDACAESQSAECLTAMQGFLICMQDSCADACATSSGPVCGNGALDEGEQCDPTASGRIDCTTLGFVSGIATCGEDCVADTSTCEGEPRVVCGDGTAAGTEACDGSDLRGLTCAGLGFSGGTLGCSGCTYDVSGCTGDQPTCGNGVLDDGEQCDPAGFLEETCTSLGFDGGTLTCSAFCAFDTQACTTNTSVCGDGVVAFDEECDWAAPFTTTCVDLGYNSGTAFCSGTCTIDQSNCSFASACGNGLLDPGEVCDASAGDFLPTCVDQGFTGGTMACNPTFCSLDTSGCMSETVCDVSGATRLTLGSLTSGTLTSSDLFGGPRGYNYDVFRFSGTAGTTYHIVYRSADYDTYLVVGDDTCAVLDWSDDDGGTLTGALNETDSYLAYTPATNGPVYVFATSYSSGVTGTYDISASTVAP